VSCGHFKVGQDFYTVKEMSISRFKWWFAAAYSPNPMLVKLTMKVCRLKEDGKLTLTDVSTGL
jgi:ABC-type proline/glycine betaine transport system substrate-binding protein